MDNSDLAKSTSKIVVFSPTFVEGLRSRTSSSKLSSAAKEDPTVLID